MQFNSVTVVMGYWSHDAQEANGATKSDRKDPHTVQPGLDCHHTRPSSEVSSGGSATSSFKHSYYVPEAAPNFWVWTQCS